MAYNDNQRAGLRAEMQADPLVRGYSGMSNAATLTDLEALTRERNRTSMTPSEIYNSIDTGVWGGTGTTATELSVAKKQEVWDILHLGDPINPFGQEATRFKDIFGLLSSTSVALAAARKEDISRLNELGLPVPTLHQISVAKA